MWVVINELGTATNGIWEIRIEPNREPYDGGTPKFDIILYTIEDGTRISRDMLVDWVDFDTAKEKIAKAVLAINALEKKRKEGGELNAIDTETLRPQGN